MTASRIVAALSAALLFWSTLAMAAAPTATTVAASSLTTSTALLNGIGAPGGEASTGYFRIATTDPGTCTTSFGSRVPASSGTDLGAGTAPVNYSITATGLIPGTTYWFCALVQNASGTALGAVLSFTVPAPPAVTTEPANPVATTSATLQGTGNPLGSTTTGWFRYSSTDPGSCNDTFGTRAPTSGGSSLGAGTAPVPFSRAITGLLPGTTTYACAIASNAYGTTFGDVVTVVTPPSEPTVSTSSPTSITGTTATLRSTVNPGGAATSAWFRYGTVSPGTCNDSFGTRAPTTGGTTVPAGNSSVPVTQNITGLVPGQTYYACALAQNSAGLVVGSVITIITPLPPTVTTSPASSISDTSVTLSGQGTPNRATTTAWFRYSSTNPVTCNDTFGSRAPTSGGANLGAGTSAQSFSEFISGLSAGDTYYFCAIASSSEGIAFGEVRSFTTATSPQVTTDVATSITDSTAVLAGSGDPNGGSATGWFRYSSTDPGTCNDSFGTRAPSSSGTGLGSGTDPVPFTRSITGLLPGQTYYYCALVSNPYGTAFGTVRSFTTPATAPTAITSSATAITGTTATLRGSSNPNGATTGGWFRYSTVSPGTCNDSFGTRAPTTGAVAVGSGNSTVSFTQDVTGLTPGATYYVCALAQNAEGIAFGSVTTFTMALPPEVTTLATTSLADTSVSLNGTATPNRAATTGWFRYATTAPMACNDTFGSRAPTSGGTSLGSGTSPQSFTQFITGLSAGTTYYYCAIAQSTEGLRFGEVLSFTTVTAPTTTTQAASGVTTSTATFNGTSNPNGASATGWFRYSTTDPGACNDSFGTRNPSSSGTGLGSGSTDVPYSRSVSGLLPGTTYYYCAISSNPYGSSFGTVVSFTTPTAAPTVSTSSATDITGTTATFRGSANPGGAATTGWFRYSTISPGTCNDTFGTRTPTTGGSPVGSGTSSTAFTQPVTGLVAGTTYYVCAIAENAVAKDWGSVVSFTTPTPPTVTTSPASVIGNSTATLNGSANPNRASTTGWFRYSATQPPACNDTFGSRAPTSGGTSLGSGTSDQGFSQSISGLTSGATYWYCAIASSSEGTRFGALQSFTTVDVPGVTTGVASSLTTTSAVLNATADPNGGSTTGWFRYSSTNPGTCSDSFGTRAPTSGGSSVGSGDGDVPFSRTISGLLPGQTYYVCAIASNTYGTSFGSVTSFTTPVAAPSVSTSSATSVTSTTATVRGSANPNGADTVGWFRYSTTNPIDCNGTFGLRAPAMGGTNLGAGNSSVSFDQPLTGLAAGTTYYVCAVAQNSAGISYGSVTSFTTSLPPDVTTDGVVGLTNTSVSIVGLATPNRAATTGWFRYSATQPLACDDAFGTRAPTTGGTNLGSGTSEIDFAEFISGLSPDTTYYYCAIASSVEGTSFGQVLSFRTLAPPVVATSSPSVVTSTTATLDAIANPKGASTTGWFRYSTTNPGTCSDSFGSRAPTSGGSSLGSGTIDVPYARSISGLVPGTTYYVCAIASNAYGTVTGNVVSFTTPASAPTVSTSSATLITGTTATLRGTVNAGGALTGGWFRYSTISPGTCNDTFGTRAPTTGAVNVGSSTSSVSYEQAITGLVAGTTYYVCAIAQNSEGLAWGSVVTFVTPLPPTAVTLPADGLSNSSAVLNANGNPNRAATTGWFRYAFTNPGTCNDTFGSRAPVTGASNLGSGTSPVAYFQEVDGLTAGTVYYYCAIVSSSEGLAFGEVRSFTTLDAPIVTTAAATLVTASSATLNGFANPNGSSTTTWFRYSTTNPGACSDAFGSRAPTSGGTSIGAGTSDVPFSRSISGLLPGTTYYVCALASSSYGQSTGTLLSFTTPATAPTVSTLGTTLVTSTGADLNGSANPNGASTVGWFRYDTTSPGTCNDTFGTRAPTVGGTALGNGTSGASFAQTLSNLQPGTTYYACAIAQNAVGLSFGTVVSFTTRRPPTVTTLAATPVTATTATLNGSASPNGDATTGWLRYSTTSPGTCNDTFGTRAPLTGGTNLGGGSTPVAFSQPITGLSPGTTYFVCAIASSVIGTSFGEVLSFTTPANVPAVTTLTPSSISVGSATLEGRAIPNGAATGGWFRYSTTNPVTCNDTFGTRAPGTGFVALGSGANPVPYSVPISGLARNTTYYVCAIAQNTSGPGFGAIVSFTTTDTCPVGIGDSDGDGVCDNVDVCLGDDATGDTDGDGICADQDPCLGDNASGDADGDGVCNDLDATCDLADFDLGSAVGFALETGSTCGEGNDVAPANFTTCGTSAGAGAGDDVVYTWTAPFAGAFAFTTHGSSFDTTILVLENGDCGELACNDDYPATLRPLRSSVVLPLTAGQTVSVVVDGNGSACGAYSLSIVPVTNAGLVLETPVAAGSTVVWTVIGASPGAPLRLFFSRPGATGNNPTPFPGGPTSTLANPRGVAQVQVPVQGTFEVSAAAPANLPSGLPFTFQGVYWDGVTGGLTDIAAATSQ